MTHENSEASCQQIASYRIRIGDDETFDEEFNFDDPVPTGRQIIQKAGRRAVAEHQLLLLTQDRRLEEIDLEETVDLRARGVERFLIFRTDRMFQLVVDDRRFPWGSERINESTLRFLADVGPEYNVWQERRGEDDLLIMPGSSANLAGKGVEVFFTGKDQTNAG